MKAIQVNKLYTKLTPQEQAALFFEATVRRDNVEAEAIKASVPIQNFSHFHSDFTHRAIGFLLLTGFYGTIYFQTNDHEESFITPENERYCAGGSGMRSIKFLEI